MTNSDQDHTPLDAAGEHVRLVEPAETPIEEPGVAAEVDLQVEDQTEPSAVIPAEATGGVLQELGFGLHDSSWTDSEWLALLERLVGEELFSWSDVTWLALGHLNPSQVGTSLASSDGFKRNYGKGSTMAVVIEWLYGQSGRCPDCRTRLELQADHVNPREQFDDPHDADVIENMVLRCRRHNVIRRPSHALGGTTFLTLEAALMWILLVIRPRTLIDYKRLCRIYGMSMSDIRINEAWAMAYWLAAEGLYEIEEDRSGVYRLLRWPDNSVTRSRIDEPVPADASIAFDEVPGTSALGFITVTEPGATDYYFRQIPVAEIPFATYDLGDRAPNELAVHYVAPKKGARATSRRIFPLPPRNHEIIAMHVRRADQAFVVRAATARGADRGFEPGDSKRKKLRDGARLVAGSIGLDVL